ncbi:MAG: serine hydrolase, partial [Clostridia bacterium]|nr:serine hydrolase [Clostridia bacterium]
EGRHEQTRFLRPETVRLMETEAAAKHLEPEPGYTWGLGVKIRQNKDKGGFACTEGTYGWSGAYGTHFFISPADRLEAVFATNVSNIGGSGSFVNPVLEELVFDIFTKGER